LILIRRRKHADLAVTGIDGGERITIEQQRRNAPARETADETQTITGSPENDGQRLTTALSGEPPIEGSNVNLGARAAGHENPGERSPMFTEQSGFCNLIWRLSQPEASSGDSGLSSTSTLSFRPQVRLSI